MARKEPDESSTLEPLIPEPETCCVTRAPSFSRLGSYLVRAHFFVLSISESRLELSTSRWFYASGLAGELIFRAKFGALIVILSVFRRSYFPQCCAISDLNPLLNCSISLANIKIILFDSQCFSPQSIYFFCLDSVTLLRYVFEFFARLVIPVLCLYTRDNSHSDHTQKRLCGGLYYF